MFLPQYQIDTFFITALLTILGYSINDTIVVFDRIRTNLEKFAGKS
jgi:preprotein translocase subunit SecF